MVLLDLENYQKKKGDCEFRQKYLKAIVLNLWQSFYTRSHLELKGVLKISCPGKFRRIARKPLTWEKGVHHVVLPGTFPKYFREV